MSNPIRVILFCGFLGSGKTSALCHVLKQRMGQRTAVLLNEFGELSVDATRLPLGDDIVLTEINGGSIFCMCKKGALLEALTRLAREVQPDLLLMEASGLAEPADLTVLLQIPQLQGAFALPQTVTLVDALNYPKLVTILPALSEQVRVADLLLVNKCDRADSTALAALVLSLRRLNPTAALMQTHHGCFQLEDIPLIAHHIGDRQPLRNGPPGGVVRVDWQSRKQVRRARLVALMNRFGSHLLRGKGWVFTQAGEMLRLEVVNGEITLLPTTESALLKRTESALFFVFAEQIPVGFSAALEELTD